MNYRLRFVPLSPNHKIAGVGMAGNMMIVTNELLMINDDDNVWVDMCDYETICGINKDESLWGRFFSQIPKPENATLIDLVSRQPIIIYNEKYSIDSPLMVMSKEKFFKHFSLKKEIYDEIELFFNNFLISKKTLGCQIRLGDMVNNHNTSKIDHYIKRIKDILHENSDIDQIFVATDDNKGIHFLEDSLNIPILYQKDIYRTSSDNPYTRLYDEREEHNYRLCKEVIKDIFLLSKCDYFLRAHTSSVSLMATMFSENIKKIYFV